MPPKDRRPAALEAPAESWWNGRGPTYLLAVFMGIIVLAMTPYTNNLDDIKQSLFAIFGSVLAVVGVAGILAGAFPMPHRPIWAGLGVYFVVLIVSTLHSQYRWAGWSVIVMQWGSIGFFLMGMASGATWRRAHAWHIIAVAIFLSTLLFGFFQYDLFGTGSTGVTWLYDLLYKTRPRNLDPTFLQGILFTYASDGKLSLMSTILNRDFFACFCLLYLPMALALALLAEHRWSLGLAVMTALMGIVTVVLCQSKGELIFGSLMIAIFVTLQVVAIRKSAQPMRLILGWSAGAALLLVTFVVLNLPTMMGQLKSVAFSASSRQIIFSGAWKIFLRFPIMGGGPGTFKIYFPLFRAPDYYNHEISNVTELAHNYFLDILSETGFVGFLAFMTFLLPLIVLGAKGILKAGDYRVRMLLIAGLCGLFGMYGSNLTSTSARWPIGAVGLWTMMGFVAGLIRQGEGWVPDAAPGERLAKLFGPRPDRPTLEKVGILSLAVLLSALGAWEGNRFWQGARTYSAGLTNFERVMRSHQQDLREPEKMDPAILKQVIDRLEESRDNFLRLGKIYPEYISGYYKLGSVENALSKAEPAKYGEHLLNSQQAYETLRSFAPEYAELHYNLGIVYYERAKYAARRLDQLATDDPKRKEIETERALYEAQSREFFESMGRMSDKSDVIFNLGYAYMDSNDLVKARDTFMKGMKLYPTDPQFPRMVLSICQELHDARGQLDALKLLVKIYPADRPPQSFLIPALHIASQNGFDEDFEALSKLGIERNPVDARIYAEQTMHYSARKDAAKAAAAAIKYKRLIGEIEMAKLVGTSDRDKLILTGAKAADEGGLAAEARHLYTALGDGASTYSMIARAWLAAHP